MTAPQQCRRDQLELYLACRKVRLADALADDGLPALVDQYVVSGKGRAVVIVAAVCEGQEFDSQVSAGSP